MTLLQRLTPSLALLAIFVLDVLGWPTAPGIEGSDAPYAETWLGERIDVSVPRLFDGGVGRDT
jgi:hypothetical protein